jgi:hypothetical protein
MRRVSVNESLDASFLVWVLRLILLAAAVTFVTGVPERVGHLARVAAAVLFALALLGLVLERAILRGDRPGDRTSGGPPPAP